MKQAYKVELTLVDAGYAEAAKLEAALAELVTKTAGLTVGRFSPAGKKRKPAAGAGKPSKPAG